MRHVHKVNHLGRTASHRKALLMNMANSLLEHKHIFTTKAKARALRTYIEPLITRSKDNNTHNRRIAFSYLKDKVAIQNLFDVVGPKVGTRPGGYTRIIKVAPRRGDAAEMALIELVDFSLNPGKGASAGTSAAVEAPKKRTRRGASKKTSESKEEKTA